MSHIGFFFLILVGWNIKALTSQTAHAQDSTPSKTFIDYEQLTHTIIIDELRAGNHDKKGHNDYYFKITATGLINKSVEKKKELAARKQLSSHFDAFCQISLPALSIWRPETKDDKSKCTASIAGSTLRALTAAMMTKFQVHEDHIAIKIDIQMWERNRRFYFLENDLQVALVTYFPLPYTPSTQKARTNQELTIKDELGTSVGINITYEHPVKKEP